MVESQSRSSHPGPLAVISAVSSSRRHTIALSEIVAKTSPRASPAPSSTHLAAEFESQLSELCFEDLPLAQADLDELQQRADVAEDELRIHQGNLQQQSAHYRHATRLFHLSPVLQDEAERVLKAAELRWRELRKARDAIELRLGRAAEKLSSLHEKKRELLTLVPRRVRLSLVFLQCMQQLLYWMQTFFF